MFLLVFQPKVLAAACAAFMDTTVGKLMNVCAPPAAIVPVCEPPYPNVSVGLAAI